MITTKQLMAVMAVTALLAVGLVGVGYAYTASTSNTSNSTTAAFIALSQGNSDAAYSSTFDDKSVTYDTYTLNTTTQYMFFNGVMDEDADYLVNDSGWASSDATTYNAALEEKKSDLITSYIAYKPAEVSFAAALAAAGITGINVATATSDEVIAAISASNAEDATKTALTTQNTQFQTLKTTYNAKVAAANAINDTNAEIFKLGEKDFTITGQNTPDNKIPVYKFSVKATGLDFDHYRYFVAAKADNSATLV